MNGGIDEYNRLHSADDADERNANYKSLVNSYYDLATLFYEWGWGQSFHFAYRHPHEDFGESIRRHEHYLASKLGLSPTASNLKVLDVGCGIGGPMRNICKFTGADVTGLTLNQYQVDRGNEFCEANPQVGAGRLYAHAIQGLQLRCRVCHRGDVPRTRSTWGVFRNVPRPEARFGLCLLRVVHDG